MYRMKLLIAGLGLIVTALGRPALAGPYSGPTDTAHPVDPAIPSSSPLFVEWADQILPLGAGTYFAPRGSASISLTGYNSLGDLDATQIANGDSPGYLTVTFPTGIRNGVGHDFAVFENGFTYGSPNGLFAEFAYVEVSTNGADFVRFDSISTNTAPVAGSGAFAGYDMSNVYNLAGKHAAGYGTPFDLTQLASKPLVLSGHVDLDNIQYVRLCDIPGNGSFLDSLGNPIRDNWLTTGTGGFDFRLPAGQGIGVINVVPEPASLALLGLGSVLLATRRKSRRNSLHFLVGLVGCAGLFSTSSAQAITFDDVDYWVGTGSNRAGFVIDWNDGKSAESLVWGYRWDGTKKGEDMLMAIVAADARLFMHVSTPGGYGVALFGAGYDLDGDGVFGVSPALSFDAGGLSVGSPNDSRVPTDSADHWKEGWMTAGYWSYWLGGSGNSPIWGFSGTGMSGRTLTNHCWDGWSWAPGFSGSAPSEPVPAQVPEPASGLIMALGLLAVIRRR
ncbi:MAG: PEP-CTERM sorting domain-containing protein [Phycisphaerae bacterium]